MRAALLFYVPLSLLFMTALVACPDPKMPTGPAPEYEEPAPPSWLEGGAPPAPVSAPAPADAGAG